MSEMRDVTLRVQLESAPDWREKTQEEFTEWAQKHEMYPLLKPKAWPDKPLGSYYRGERWLIYWDGQLLGFTDDPDDIGEWL